MSLVGALQHVLAGEHAAVYAYAVVGGVLGPGTATARLSGDAYDVHGARRDRVDALLRALDVEPPPAEPGYALPAPVTSPGDAALLARRVEDRCAVLYAALVAATTADQRALAVAWLEDAATRALAWGAPPTAFPGVGLA